MPVYDAFDWQISIVLIDSLLEHLRARTHISARTRGRPREFMGDPCGVRRFVALKKTTVKGLGNEHEKSI